MILITNNDMAAMLDALPVPVDTHINGQCAGETVVVLAGNDTEMQERIRELKKARAGMVLPLPVGIEPHEVPERLATLSSVSRVKHANGPSMALLKHALATVTHQKSPLWGDALDAQIAHIAEATAAPREYADLVAMTVIGGLATGRFSLEVRPGWIERPILHAALVGDSGCGKSPLLGAMSSVLHHRQIDPPTNGINTTGITPRWAIGDATIEAAALVCAQQQRGIIKVVDELADHLASMSRYSKANAGGDRAQWLKAWNGGAETVDRKHLQAPLMIRHFGISVIGGIQPQRLKLLFDGIDDGLSARTIVVYPDPVPIQKHGPESVSQAVWEHAVDTLIDHRLDDTEEQAIPLSDEARAYFEEWRFNLLTRLRNSGKHVDGWRNKAPAMVARFALILALGNAAATGGIPHQVTRADVEKAIAYLRLVNSHRRRVLLEVGTSGIEHIAIELARFIIETRTDRLDTHELRHGNLIVGLRDPDILRRALTELAHARWLKTRIPTRRDDPIPPMVKIDPAVFSLLERVN